MRLCKKSIFALFLTVTMAVQLTSGAMAYTTPDFTDVAPDSWAYESVMRMADAGIIKGTGATTFSPDMKLSAAMFLTLVGRVAYPGDVTAGGAASWYAPWVEAAKAKGLLEGTTVIDAAIEGEITRYDMAVILAHTAKTLGAQEQTVDTAKITDWGDIPNKYSYAVGQTYALGLIRGDNAGRFNGTLTMTRAEAATVIARLVDLVADLATQSPAEPEKPEETTPPVELTGETKTFTIKGGAEYQSQKDFTWKGAEGATIILYYKDGTELGRVVSGSNGDFAMEVTVDMAYYSYADECYYTQATFIDDDGYKYSNISKDGYIAYYSLWNKKDTWGISLYGNDAMVLDF